MSGAAPLVEALAYLSVLEDPQHGLTGGCLVVNPAGRPLEFHCTAPVAPTHAQEILFGQTLRPHLVAEVIAPALLAACRVRAALVVVDDPLLARCGEAVGATTVCLAETAAEGDGQEPLTRDGGSEPQTLAEAPALLGALASHVDPREPFERIHEAIREAQRLGAGGAPASDAA